MTSKTFLRRSIAKWNLLCKRSFELERKIQRNLSWNILNELFDKFERSVEEANKQHYFFSNFKMKIVFFAFF